MKRRTLLQSATALAAFGAFAKLEPGVAQDATPDSATPETTTGIPPIRWALASIDSGEDSLVPDNANNFTLQFGPDGRVGIKADCNAAGGSYELEGESIAITDVFSTMAFCGDDSLDQDFLAAIQTATTFSISRDPGDQLALNLDTDGSRVLLNPTLPGVVWEWQEFLGGDGTTITPNAPERYTIEFLEDGSVQVVADCNTGRGDAVLDGSAIDLTVATTKKMCADDSFFNDYMRVLDEASEWIIAGGDLYLNLPLDSGGARFKAIYMSPDDAATPES